MTSKKLTEIEKAIGHRFRDRSLLQAALTHRSFAYEQVGSSQDNQRLEFLGDAVLQIVITEHLYSSHPAWTEGRLTQARSVFTRRKTVSRLARQMGLGDHVRLGRGEERAEGRARPSILGDALEALFAAVYLDAGMEAARKVILAVMEPAFAAWAEETEPENPKGLLQEWLQSRGKPRPSYRVASETGPDHRKEFRVVAELDGEVLAEGAGTSKKSAEMDAAARALAVLADVPTEDLYEPPSEATTEA